MKKKEMWILTLFRIAILSSMLFLPSLTGYTQGNRPGIDISSSYPQYWEYGGQPVMLLGGSVEDNLFQIPDLEEHLDLLVSVGGNYVRNTMSSRDPGNVWAFDKDPESGKYNLERWNEEYWERFSRLLELTSGRGIIVQVEIWATFDFYRENWAVNPFNPVNNINYTADRTKLPGVVSTHPTFCDNPFFWSIPSQHNNMPVLNYQQKFVDRLLSISLRYGNVLYCIDNETSVTSDWGAFWSDYIRKKAAEEGKTVHITEMWDPHDLNHISHRETFDRPEIYSFVEISQNNHQRGEAHWNNGLRQIERLRNAGHLRPVNNVKTYGADGGMHGGGTRNGIESFVRSTLFGSAAVRFHRPPSGLGLNDTAQAVIRGLRDAIERISFFEAAPHNELLEGRSENEAYCRGIPGKEFLVYFPGLGSVELQTGIPGEKISVSRVQLLEGTWNMEDPEFNQGRIRLETNGEHTLFIIQ
jgi:hypothetical protein